MHVMLIVPGTSDVLIDCNIDCSQQEQTTRKYPKDIFRVNEYRTVQQTKNTESYNRITSYPEC